MRAELAALALMLALLVVVLWAVAAAAPEQVVEALAHLSMAPA